MNVIVDAKMDAKKLRGGIDPGKEGFFTFIINDSEHLFEPFPKIGKEVDLRELDDIIKTVLVCKDVHFVIEDLHAKYGSSAKSTFNFGYICGAVEQLLISNKVPYTKVKPKEWQKEMWQGVVVQKKPSTTGKTLVNDTKATSLIAAKRLFPNIDFRKNTRCKVPHDGKVDSLLMAEYCKRKF